MAIILEKDPQGKPKKMKSTVFPPTKKEEEIAIIFDNFLQKSIPEIEQEFIEKGLLSHKRLTKNPQGNVKLWFTLGGRVKKIIHENNLVKPSEYIWALEAVRNYMSPRLLRKDRGSRLHLDYCIRVSDFPWEEIKRRNWSDWVYLMDSKSLRNETRADIWIRKNIKELSKLGRKQFRGLVQKINTELKDIDTSVYNNKELFSIYDSVLTGSLKNE